MKNYTITVNGNVYKVTVEEGVSTSAAPVARAAAPTPKAAPAAAPKATSTGAAGSAAVPAPMPGKTLGAKAVVGQAVKKDDVVVVLETMKMENEIIAPPDGTVASANVSADDFVEAGATLVTSNQDSAL